MRLLEEQGNLPKLRVTQAISETRHAGQSNAIPCFPIGFSHRIIGHSHLVQPNEGRGLRKHPQCDLHADFYGSSVWTRIRASDGSSRARILSELLLLKRCRRLGNAIAMSPSSDNSWAIG